MAGRRTAWFALGLGVCCLLSGGIPLLAHAEHAGGVRDVGAIPKAGAYAQPQDGAETPPHRSGSTNVVRPAPVRPVPVRVRVARLHIDASVVPVTADRNGALGVPDDPLVTGWWNASARPGAQSGSVVIDGHVDSATRGLGAFFRLGDVRPGDRVVVTNASGQASTYKVVARRRYAKTALPATEIFGQAASPRLVLVTCGGTFNRDTGSYLDNVVIYAVPT